MTFAEAFDLSAIPGEIFRRSAESLADEIINGPLVVNLPAGMAQGHAMATCAEVQHHLATTNARPAAPITLDSLEEMHREYLRDRELERLRDVFRDRFAMSADVAIPLEPIRFKQPEPESDEMALLRMTFGSIRFIEPPVGMMVRGHAIDPVHTAKTLAYAFDCDGHRRPSMVEFDFDAITREIEKATKPRELSFSERRRRRIITGGLSDGKGLERPRDRGRRHGNDRVQGAIGHRRRSQNQGRN